MAILFLSGASHPNAVQNNPQASIGGYISSSQVPNGGINALFDDVSCYGMSKKIKSTIGIFLKNHGQETLNNIVIQQVYHNDFGVETDCVKFEWAAVEPKDNQYIEKIGNRSNYPLGADFFDPKAKREHATLEILTPGQAGDVVEVLGVSALLEGNTIEDVVMAIVNAFEDNLDFTAEAKGDNAIYFERIEFIFTGDPIDLITPGDATASPTNFAGGIDEGVLLIEELLPGETLGLWVRRSIKHGTKTECVTLEEQYDEMFGEEFSEKRVEDHVDNEECHEVIFSWS